MPRCYISLGGNLGTVGDTFDRALSRLQNARDTAVITVSQYLQTEAVGDEAGSRFVNAAAEIDTALSPSEFLDLLQAIELELGRVRAIRWGPRTLDLDLLFYGSEIIRSPRLVVPHPAAWYRRFVLDPLVALAPRLVHPEKQVQIEALWQRIHRRPLVAAFADGSAESRIHLIQNLKPVFPEVTFLDLNRGEADCGNLIIEPTFIFWLERSDSLKKSCGHQFVQSPPLALIDTCAASEPVFELVRHVLQSALG